MQAPAPPIQSAANPLFKNLQRLAQDSTAYRKQQRVWLEGDHLCRAALARGWQPEMAVFAASHWPPARPEVQALAGAGKRLVLLDDALMARLSTLPSPAPVAFVLALPASACADASARDALVPNAPTVVLDRVQDAGNVGSILRSAAAFGFEQVLAIKGTAALWSPKVLRAGMGAHFGLRLAEGLDVADLHALRLPLLATSSHQGQWLHRSALPWPCAWLLGHEGQGISPALAALAQHHVRIAQPGGEESLNVAAAAAICLHASAAGMTRT